jgi:hypothetical protein
MIQVIVVQGDEEDEGNPWLATVMLYHSWEEAMEVVAELKKEMLTQVTLTWRN